MYKKKSADQRVIDLKSLFSTSETYSVAYSSIAKTPILFQCVREKLENIYENLQEDAASNSVPGSKTTSPHPCGEVAKVPQKYASANKNNN